MRLAKVKLDTSTKAGAAPHASRDQGYLRLAAKLEQPLLMEHASKFRLRDETPDTRTRLKPNANIHREKNVEAERRRRRREYGEQAARRFKIEKQRRAVRARQIDEKKRRAAEAQESKVSRMKRSASQTPWEAMYNND